MKKYMKKVKETEGEGKGEQNIPFLLPSLPTGYNERYISIDKSLGDEKYFPKDLLEVSFFQ